MKDSIMLTRHLEGSVYDSGSLSEAISGMVYRGESVVRTVQAGLKSDTDNFSNEILHDVLETVSLELIDIKTLAEQFHENQIANKGNNIDLEVLQKAIFACEVGMNHLNYLASLFQGIIKLTENNPDFQAIRGLAELGYYQYENAHNDLDVDREDFRQIEKLYLKESKLG